MKGTSTSSRVVSGSWLSVGLVLAAAGCGAVGGSAMPDQTSSAPPNPTEAGRTKSTPGGFTQTGEGSLPPPILPKHGEKPPALDDAAVKKIATKVTATASVRKRVYRPLEPIEVEYEVRNANDVFFDLAYPNADLPPVRVVDASGLPVPETVQHRRLIELAGYAGYSNRGALFKDKPHRGVVVANWAYDMTMPGTYRVRVDVPYEAGMQDGKMRILHAVSEPIEVTVEGTPISALPPPEPGRGSTSRRPREQRAKEGRP